MRSPLIIVTILMILSLFQSTNTPAAAADNAELFQQGNEAYSRGDYEEAISHFETLVNNNGFSAQILYNLAGSYGQAGKTGKAVVNYERALRLAPSDADTSGNLELIRKENGLFQIESNGPERVFRLLGLNQWAASLLLCLGFFTVFIFAHRIFVYSRTATIATSTACLVLLLVSLYGTFLGYREFNPSVVTESQARLLVSPFESSASVGTIKEGRLVYPLKEHNGYRYVEDKTGRKGWILESHIEPVCTLPEKLPATG